jgi:hypothetical protein
MCEVCKVAKELGYKNVSKFKEQPVFSRDGKPVKMWKNKDGSITIEL